MRNLILLAAPGAGKGTIADELKESLGYSHISMGDLLRERRNQPDEIGKIIAEKQDAGAFVPKEIVYAVIEERLKEEDCKNGFILDGFPRSIEQDIEYQQIVERLGIEPGIVISLEISREELVERITGRRTCKDCGEGHNIFFPPKAPKVENTCNKCNGELFKRSDDTEEMANTRYDTYLKNTEPLINYYKDKGVLYTFDSTESQQAVNQIVDLLDNNFGQKIKKKGSIE